MENISQEQVRACVHPGQKIISYFSAVLTLGILGFLLLAGFFGAEIRSAVQTKYIEGYRATHIEAISLNDTQVIALLPEIEANIISFSNYLYWPLVGLIPLAFFVLVFLTMAKDYGKLHSDGVQLDPKQYPQVYALFAEMAGRLGLKKVPDIFLINGNGELNAYATCVPGYRNFVAIYSDIFDVCIERNDMEALAFILGHELGHIRLHHSNIWYNFFNILMKIWLMNYIFGLPLSRAQEYSADKVGQLLSSDTQGKSLTLLAAGRRNYATMNFERYVENQVKTRHITGVLHNFFQNHPVISWRVAALTHHWHGELFFPCKKMK